MHIQKRKILIVSERPACPGSFAPFAACWLRLYFQRCLKGFIKTTTAHTKRQRVAVTERVIDVLAGLLCGRSTVDLVVSQRFQWNTLSDTECYVKVHQTTAAVEVPTLCTVHAETIIQVNVNQIQVNVNPAIPNRYGVHLRF